MSSYKEHVKDKVRKISETVDEKEADLYQSVVDWSLFIRFILQVVVIGSTTLFLLYLGGLIR